MQDTPLRPRLTVR